VILFIDKIDFEVKEKIKLFPLISRSNCVDELVGGESHKIYAIDTYSKNVVGYILVNPSIGNLPPEIQFIEVQLKYQKSGIGSSLLEKALDFLRKNKEKRVSLFPLSGSANFFLKRNFYKKGLQMFLDL